MSRWNRKDRLLILMAVGELVGFLVGVLVGELVGFVVLYVVGIVGVLVIVFVVNPDGENFFGSTPAGYGLVATVRRPSQDSRELARPRMVPPVTIRSLRWVSVLLPSEESITWSAEVASCLAETPDPGERRRYVRSYRREAPQLIWVSWTEYLRHRDRS